ncbi:MAG: hypothetical protein R2754_12675 [Microthrixaceae bacterium]
MTKHMSESELSPALLRVLESAEDWAAVISVCEELALALSGATR